ncbi:hypothetical protein NE237_022975 [Protea cynaroides]|uniref:Ribosome biogenesis protein slx9-like n=1 Tax=Protea cynaroides TaxID=273540 RepID=A0A9Q0HAL9_9MAGN|nr:hypothetical protein NE237_022975 [Protea cynaroides]
MVQLSPLPSVTSAAILFGEDDCSFNIPKELLEMGLTGLRPDSTYKESSKHSDRKFEKKLQFYAKVRDTVASLSAKKGISKKKKLRSRHKKLKAYDLSSLSEFLPELKAGQLPPVTNLKQNAKSRQKLVEKEGKQFLKVLNSPVFQSDPLSAIHQHLQNTQPVQVNKPEKSSGRSGKKTKKKRSKNTSGSQSMDI